MKISQIRFNRFAMALLIVSIISGCSKDDGAPGTSVIEGLLYYYTNEDAKELRVVDISLTSPIRRSFKLSTDVTLEQIAIDREDLVVRVYRPSTISSLATAKGKLIKSKVLEDNWLFVANNPYEGLTGITEDGWHDSSQFSNNATGFKFHSMGSIDGEEVYAIESVGYPGRYFSHSGHPIQGANLLYLETYPEPKDAPKFRLYRPKANFTEGAIDVPVDAMFSN